METIGDCLSGFLNEELVLTRRAAVTSVEWCPQEASMLTTTGADGQLCVWDLALERDPEEEMNLGEESNAETPEDLPPQLLFVHGGQSELKEASLVQSVHGGTY